MKDVNQAVDAKIKYRLKGEFLSNRKKTREDFLYF